MRHRIPAFLAVLASLLALAGCGHGGSAAAGNTNRPLSEVSASAAMPKGTRPSGPVITSACRELSRTEVASALGVPAVIAQELPGGKTPGGSAHACSYLGGGAQLRLIISAKPATNGSSAQLAVSMYSQLYVGVSRDVPGLGDAASFTGPGGPGPDQGWQVLVTARAEGSQLRMITIMAFCQGDARSGLISLGRHVLARI